MEYQITSRSGHLSDQEIRQAVVRFLNPTVRVSHLHTILSPSGHTQSVGQSSGAWRPAKPVKPTFKRLSPAHLANHQASVQVSQVQKDIHIRHKSNLGGSITHFFIYDDRRLLSTDALGGHAHWQHLSMSWHHTLRLDTQKNVNQDRYPASPSTPVSQMTNWQKLIEALKRGAKKAGNNLLTLENTIIVIATLIMALMATGVLELLILGMTIFGAVIGGLDLVLNVSQLAVDGCYKAIAAQTETELDAAADIFAEAFPRGLFDILNIVVGVKALSILKGKGIFTANEYFAYLERELAIWRASRAAGQTSSRSVLSSKDRTPSKEINQKQIIATKTTNKINNIISLIENAKPLTKIKRGRQGTIKGDGPKIFEELTKNAIKKENGTYNLPDGTIISNHPSTTTGIYTIDINRAGSIYKIRIKK